MYFSVETISETTGTVLEAIEVGRVKTLSGFSTPSTEAQYSSIIERMLLRLPLGHIVMMQQPDNTLLPVENGIILEAINAFVNDGFHLTKTIVLSENLSYSQLNKVEARQFKTTQLHFGILNKNNTAEEMQAALGIIQNIKN